MRSLLINRILIVGLGSIGQRHFRLAGQLFPNADIRVLRHKSSETIINSDSGFFYDVQDAITFAPQIVIIANPATFHIQIAQLFAKTGAHLLVEKPLAASLEGVTELIATTHKLSTVLLTGYNFRFLPSLQKFRNLLIEGCIGKILSVRCEIGQFLPSWRPTSDYRRCVSARYELGGGALLELSHELDYLRWIFGEVDWVIANLSRQSSLELDVEDSAHIILGFMPSVDDRRLVGTVNLDFIRHDNTRLCIAIGEQGSLRWNGLTGEVALYKSGATEWRELFRHAHQRDDSYLAEWDNFIECITEHKAPLVTGLDGLRALEIIAAARQSHESGGKIYVSHH